MMSTNFKLVLVALVATAMWSSPVVESRLTGMIVPGMYGTANKDMLGTYGELAGALGMYGDIFPGGEYAAPPPPVALARDEEVLDKGLPSRSKSSASVGLIVGLVVAAAVVAVVAGAAIKARSTSVHRFNTANVPDVFV